MFEKIEILSDYRKHPPPPKRDLSEIYVGNKLILVTFLVHKSDSISFHSLISHPIIVSTHVPMQYTTYIPYCTVSAYGKNSKIQKNKSHTAIYEMHDLGQ